MFLLFLVCKLSDGAVSMQCHAGHPVDTGMRPANQEQAQSRQSRPDLLECCFLDIGNHKRPRSLLHACNVVQPVEMATGFHTRKGFRVGQQLRAVVAPIFSAVFSI